LDQELARCSAATRIAAALDAAAQSADGDCPALEALDRDLSGLDATRAPLEGLRSLLDAELARCDRARRYREAVADAQLDCAALRAVQRELAADDTTREPLRAIRGRLDETLGRCDALDRLDQSTGEGVEPP
jgi:hypothetical protein